MTSTSCSHTEDRLLGTVMLYPDTIHQAIGLKPDDFENPLNALLWQAFLDLHAAGKDIGDPILIMDTLKASGNLEKVGGAVRFSELRSTVANSSGIQEYVRIMQRETLRSASRIAATQFLGAIEDTEPSEAIESLLGALAGQKQKTGVKTGLTMREVARNALDEAEKLNNQTFQTGYYAIDRILGGQMGETSFTVIAAGPSFGKSCFALNMALNGTRNGKPIRCLYVCMEMSASELFDRMVSAEAMVPTQMARSLRLGLASKSDNERNGQAHADSIGRLAMTGHIIQADGLIDINQFRSLVAMHHDHIDCAILDYIQQLKPTSPGQQTMERVNEASWTCKDLAVKYKLPIIALAQLNREGYKEGKKPELCNLRETGQLEQDADNVWMLWREKKEMVQEEEIEVFIAKNRGGAIARISLNFLLNYGRIENLKPRNG